MKTLVTIVGARPQFIKAAALSRALAKSNLKETLVHTGQHFDDAMSKVFFDELDIPAPAHHLNIHSLTHGVMTGQMLSAIEGVLTQQKPDGVLVYGDTNSTLAGALAAAKLSIPVIHVEAGLRSFNRDMPEEINRVLTDHMSGLLLCPTGEAMKNLAREGITSGVRHVGDVMYDATLHATGMALSQSKILETLKLAPKSYALATIHRQENTDSKEALQKVVNYLGGEAKVRPIVLPLHPRTEKMLASHGLALPAGVVKCAPLGYLDMHRLLHDAAQVYTDSGGVQKEAYFHQVPCVTLRGETEWVETVAHGWNRLWHENDWRPRTSIADYGQGKAAQYCVEAIDAFLA
jgi:UDP-GlcNAc3NAcA epimerase